MLAPERKVRFVYLVLCGDCQRMAVNPSCIHVRRQPSSTFQYFPCHSRASSQQFKSSSSIFCFDGMDLLSRHDSGAVRRSLARMRRQKNKTNIVHGAWYENDRGSNVQCAYTTCVPPNTCRASSLLQTGSSFNIFRKINSQ